MKGSRLESPGDDQFTCFAVSPSKLCPYKNHWTLTLEDGRGERTLHTWNKKMGSLRLAGTTVTWGGTRYQFFSSFSQNFLKLFEESLHFFLGCVFQVIFDGCYHDKPPLNHIKSPPFGRICLDIVPSTKQSQIYAKLCGRFSLSTGWEINRRMSAKSTVVARTRWAHTSFKSGYNHHK